MNEQNVRIAGFRCGRPHVERLRVTARETHRTLSDVLRLLVRQAVVCEPNIRLCFVQKEERDGADLQ